MQVNNDEYEIIQLLGKGKGGYSYLAKREGKYYVVKQIHHEPCDYYNFGNKIQAEEEDYKKLSQCKIRMPKLLAIDYERERIVKEYIEGKTIYELVMEEKVTLSYIEQVKEMCKILYAHQLNIDYFPTNFIVQDGLVWYIDFECNEYSEEWNFENWGSRYWRKSMEFLDYAKSHS